MSEKTRVVVIGSGAAGAGCARTLAANEDFEVTVVERGRWGGTCLWRGCIPKKALYHTAHVTRTLQDAEQFGVVSPTPTIDWQGALAWKWHAQETYAGDQRALLEGRGITTIEGSAVFVAEDALEVDGRRIEFDHAVVATGSTSFVPPIPGAELADTSDDALRYPALPGSLVIVGAGFIAMEFAGIFASLGTLVTVLSRGDRVLEMLDPELSQAVERGLAQQGVRIVHGALATSIEGEPGSLSVRVRNNGDEVVLGAERVLMATGRRPQTAALRLDAAGVMLDEQGHVVLTGALKSTNPRLWFAGDAASGQMHTPVANLEGKTIARSIAEGVDHVPECGSVPVCCFTTPQVASVGLDEASARAQGFEVDVHRTGFDVVGAAVIADEREGLVKLVADAKTGRLLGAQIAAEQAGDLIYSATLALRAGMTAEDVSHAIAVHPTFAESVYYAGY